MIAVLLRPAAAVFAAFALVLSTRAQPTPPRLYAVEVSAAIQTNPARITLQWPADPNATGYSVSRLNGSAWTQIGTAPGSATQFVDSNVSVGSRFEYQVLK